MTTTETHALDVDAAPSTPGPRRGTPPEDAAHAAAMATLAAAAEREDGILVFPDTEAMSMHALTVEADPLPLPWPFGLALVAAGLALVTASSIFWLSWVGLGWLPSEPFVDGVAACIVVCLSSLLATLAMSGASRRSRARDASRLVDARRATMRPFGFVVSPSRLVVLRLVAAGVERHEHPCAKVSEVVVRDEDDDHVTVLVRTSSGTVDMHWIAKAREVLIALRDLQGPLPEG